MSLFKPFHYQKVAKLLLDNEKLLDCEYKSNYYTFNQCIYRSIVNRSYYAAFSYFKSWAIDEKKYDEDNEWEHYKQVAIDGGTNPPGRHETLILFIMHNYDEDKDDDNLITMSNKLEKIRKQRNVADYVFDKQFKKNRAEYVYKISNEIIEYLEYL